MTLGGVINLLLLFPPQILRVGVKIKWRDAYEGINVNSSCAFNHGRQWLGVKENGVFQLSLHWDLSLAICGTGRL